MRAALVVRDLMTRSRLQEAAAAAGYEVAAMREVPPPQGGDEWPDLLVVDLDLPGALQGAAAWRAAHPETRVIGFAFHVEEELIAEARAAGIEVLPHGATARPARFFS
jgi:DNA-binding NarL/FixJ family response regulator